MLRPVSATLDRDWFGAPCDARPTFALSLDSSAITLRGRAAKAPLFVPADNGAYTEGLWEGDCVELFLVNPKSGYYMEVNLSPRGGWWSCEFTAPRVRAGVGPRPIAGATTTCALSPDAWDATIRIPLAGLPAALDFDPTGTRGNVTFCLGNAPQLYFTHADLGGGNPNFHLPDKWVRLFA